ncbi:MAG: sulfotransferase domain-containing protein, partial [Candidatus Thorarchaeota archaeon]
NFNDIPFTEKIRLYINYHPLLISKLWQSSVLKSLKFRNHERFYSLKFEDLLLQPQEAIYNLCKFLGINYDINMLDIPHISSSFQKDNFTTRGINTTPVFRWKNGGLRDEEIYFSQKLNTNLIKSFNYNLKNDISISKFVLAYYYFIFPIKLFFSLILNFRRSRNIINSVIRRFF